MAAFLLGLGAGAWIFGRVMARVRDPVRWYGFAEIAVGVLGALIPYEIEAIRSGLSRFPLPGDAGSLAGGLLRFVITVAVLAPPCVVMGSTLPLLVRAGAEGDRSRGGGVGWLYFVNSVGAAAGCFSVGFVVLPHLGLETANGLAVGTNLLVGLVAAFGLRRHAVRNLQEVRPSLCEAPGATGQMPSATGSHSALSLAALGAGFAALMLQIAWMRELAAALGGSTYAFSAMLSIVLLGIGLGGLLHHSHFRRDRNSSMWMASLILVYLVSAALGQVLLPHVCAATGALRSLRSDGMWNASICIGASAVLELIPSVALGAMFPLLVRLRSAENGDHEQATGRTYAWNTGGTILGALLTTFVLLPRLGTHGTVALAILVGVAVLGPLCWESGAPASRGPLLYAGLCIAAVCAAVASLASSDPLVTNAGMFLYGNAPFAEIRAQGRLLYLRDGVSCSVLVKEQPGGHRSMSVNGKVDASSSLDMITQVGMAYFPRFLAPGAESVLVIGYGSGTTCGASLLFPDTNVTCCEIEPAVVEAARFFKGVNHDPEAHPAFSLVLDDARGYLQRSSAQYDLIVSEPSNPWLSGVSNLFTQEFYDLARSRLRPGGVLAQWVQVYAMDPGDVALILRTVSASFRETALFQLYGGDTLLLASDRSLRMDKDTTVAAEELLGRAPEARADLERYFGTADVRTLLVRHSVLRTEGVRRLLLRHAEEGLNTDLNLRLEHRAPRHVFDQDSDGSRVLAELVAASDARSVGQGFQDLGCTVSQVPALQTWIRVYARCGRWEDVGLLAGLAASAGPDGDSLGVGIAAQSNGTQVLSKSLLSLVSSSEEDGMGVGVELWRHREFFKAAGIFEEVASLHPQSSTAWANLAITLQADGRHERALEALERAVALDPFNDVVLHARREIIGPLQGVNSPSLPK